MQTYKAHTHTLKALLFSSEQSVNHCNTEKKKECVAVCIVCVYCKSKTRFVQSLVCAFVHGCVTTHMFLCICVCMCVFCHISRFSARWKRLMRPPSLHSCNSVTLYTVSLYHLYRWATIWDTNTTPQPQGLTALKNGAVIFFSFFKWNCLFHFPFKLSKTKKDCKSPKSIFSVCWQQKPPSLAPHQWKIWLDLILFDEIAF